MNFSFSYLQSRVIKYWVHYLSPVWPRLKSWMRHHTLYVGWDFSPSLQMQTYFLLSLLSREKSEKRLLEICLLLQTIFLQAPGFSFSSKTTMFSKFQFDQGCGRQRTTMWMYTVHVLLLSMFVLFFLNQSIILTLWFCHVNTGYHYIYHNFGNFLVELLLTNIYSEG